MGRLYRVFHTLSAHCRFVLTRVSRPAFRNNVLERVLAKVPDAASLVRAGGTSKRLQRSKWRTSLPDQNSMQVTAQLLRNFTVHAA